MNLRLFQFLEGLPPEIWAELLDQDAEQAHRRANQTAPTITSSIRWSVEMVSATFLASLDPGLRQVILMEQDETFLQAIPPALLAEATHYREAIQNRFVQVRQVWEQATAEAPGTRKFLPSRDSINLLDRPGVVALFDYCLIRKFRGRTHSKKFSSTL
jgi:E3 ubiquitin-protein ligase HUWE1